VKHKEKNVLLGFLACLVILMMGIVAEYAGLVDIPFLEIQPPEEEKKPTPTELVKGIITTDTSGFDSLDIATSRTIGTNVNVYWYAKRSGSWVLLGSGDAADINVEEQDNEVIYAAVSVPSGQSFYTDYQKILDMNSRATSVTYEDIDGDNVEEFVFRLNIADIPFASGTGKYSLPSFNVYLLSYDSSWAFPTAGKPSDMTGIGTTKITKYLEWYTEFSAEKKAVAVCKVVLVANTSDISKVTLKKLNVPGIGYLDGSSFDQDVLSSEIKWTYSISTLLYGSDYLKLPVNTLNKQEFTTSLELDLATGDQLGFTLYIYYFDSAESMQSLSDTVGISA
jgi:hypothetical protein